MPLAVVPCLQRPLQVAVVSGAAPQRRARLRIAADGSLAEVVADRGVVRRRRNIPRAVAAGRYGAVPRSTPRAGLPLRFPRARGKPACCRSGAWRRRCKSGRGSRLSLPSKLINKTSNEGGSLIFLRFRPGRKKPPWTRPPTSSTSIRTTPDATCQPYGHPVPTPNIQHLADQGVLFRHAFCATPTCSTAGRVC